MIETQNNLIEFLERALNLTRKALKLVQDNRIEELNDVLDTRERVIAIIDTLSENLNLHYTNQPPKSYEEFNNQVSQVIEKINGMDEIITSCLLHEKEKTQYEIAKTFKNKENFKGYNLNNLK